jgi:membrane dipeptidase
MPGRDRQGPDAIRLTRRDFLVASCAATASACGGGRRASVPVPAEVLDFHREILVFDLHIDTLLWQRFLGYDPTRRHEPFLPKAAFLGQMDLPRAEEAGLDGAVLGIVVAPEEERPEQHWALKLHARLEEGAGLEQTLATLELLDRDSRAAPDRLELVRSGSEIRRAAAAGRFAGLAGLEGAHGIGERVENLRVAYQKGLRMLGLVHFQASAAAYPMTVPALGNHGLTPFGFDLVAEMEALGVVVDLAHVNARGVEDALPALTRPFVVSHTACRALHDHPRNLTDDELRRVAGAGGVVGLAVGRMFLGPGGVDAFLAHADHARRVAGREAIALGSDWDGAIVPAAGLEDVRSLPALTHRLLERGWSHDDVRLFLGENALRVLTDALG